MKNQMLSNHQIALLYILRYTLKKSHDVKYTVRGQENKTLSS